MFRTTESTYLNEPTKGIRYAWIALIMGILLGRAIVSIVRPSGADEHATAGVPTAIMFGVHGAVLGAAGLSILIAARYSPSFGSGIWLWLGALSLSAGPILSGLYGTAASVSPDVIRIPLFFTAVWLLQPVNLDWFVKRCKNAIELYALATLSMIAIAPGQVLQTNYGASMIPEFTIRLYAIGGGHANSFGPLLAAYIVLGWIVPARTFKGRCILVVIVACLILTQSKTAILALGIVFAIRFFYASGIKRFLIPYTITVVGVASALIASFTNPGWYYRVGDSLFADDEVATLTGRTDLWRYSLYLWREKPVLGYGPEAWRIEMTDNFELLYFWRPGTAHNQLLQTLGESGVLGLIGLTFFLIVVTLYSIRYAGLTQGVALALVVFTLIRGITEAPIVRGLDENFFILFVTYSILMLAIKWSKDSSEGSTRNVKNRLAPRHFHVSSGAARLSPFTSNEMESIR